MGDAPGVLVDEYGWGSRVTLPPEEVGRSLPAARVTRKANQM
jgi:hypothetical protein